MQENSPGFQLTGGHVTDLSQQEKKIGKEGEKEREGLLINTV